MDWRRTPLVLKRVPKMYSRKASPPAWDSKQADSRWTLPNSDQWTTQATLAPPMDPSDLFEPSLLTTGKENVELCCDTISSETLATSDEDTFDN